MSRSYHHGALADAMIEQGLVCPTWQFRDRHTGVIATSTLGT